MNTSIRENLKKARYASSFLRKKIMHTNLQLLYLCNFRCDICDFWKPAYQEAPMLSLSEVKIISNKLAQIGPQIVSIGGGEPLLHPHIIEVVEALADQHFPAMICNGWYITPQNARELFEAGIYEVSVSVDYANAEKHDRQRGIKGAFDRAITALKILNENRVRPDQRVHMISVIMDDNLEEVERLIALCREIDITYLVTLYSDSRGIKTSREAPPDVTNRLLELKRKYNEFVSFRGYLANFSEAVQSGGIGPCYAGKNFLNIDSQGSVSLCIDRLDASAGNILTDDINSIVQRLSKLHQTNDCHNCWTSCRGCVETLMYGDKKISNLWDYYRMTKSIDAQTVAAN